MNSGKETEKNENVFIGARVLGEDGVKLVLPTYDVLISQIKQMKSVAKNLEKQNSNISRIMKYNREHNNTIAIFGKRGTGKTSVVYTLMDYLLNQNDSNKKEKNIVLPIIEPDNFGDNTKIMGSIIGLIKNEVDEILKEVKSFKNKPESYFRNCIYVENNPLKQKMDELLEHHMYSDSEYRNIITHNYTDTATHIKKSSHLLIPDINLKHKFWDVIDEIVRLYKNELNKDELKKDVMLFIFIDDIDLKTTKCKELIEAIMQYSSHPNVITILSGDYEILEEGVMLSLIGDENLREKGLDPNFILKNNIESKNELLNLDKTKIHIENSTVNTININESIETGFTIKDRKLELAENYLKKIIPPSRRHHSVDWNIYNISSFSFEKTKLIDILYEFYNNEDNIFGYKDTNSNIFSTKYPYIIFDNKPRGLINVYYSLSLIVNNDNKNFVDIKFLIDTIIDSSPYLVENKDEFSDFINWGSDFKSTQINYDKFIISEDETRSLKEYLSYFIIAEMLLYYEKNISENGIYYSKNDYDLAKKYILTSLYYSPSIAYLCKHNPSIICVDEIYSYYHFSTLYDIAITFALNLEFIDSLRFLNILLESEFMDDYGYKAYWTEPEINEKKDRYLFKSIYRFILLDEVNKKEILKKMIIYSNENSNNENKNDSDAINDFFEFLYDITKISKEYYIAKNRYNEIKSIINNSYISKQIGFLIDFKLKVRDIKEEERQEILNKVKYLEKEMAYKKIYDNVLINTITDIIMLNYEDELQSSLEDIMEEEYKKKFKNLKKLIDDIKSKKIDKSDRRIKLIEKSNEEVVNEFLKLIKVKDSIDFFQIKNDVVKIEKDEINKAKEVFLNGKDGSETKYTYIKKKTKKFFEENKDELNYSEEFKNFYIEIKELSENNKIWYGRLEARAFLYVLNSSVSIDLEKEDIKKYVPLLYYIGKFNELVNLGLKEDIEFEDTKKQMKKLLDDVYIESMEEIIKEYKEFGLDIEGKWIPLEFNIDASITINTDI